MDCPTENKNGGLVGVGLENPDRALNPMCWMWGDVQKFLELNQQWSWIAVPCQGMSGSDILTLAPAKVGELCIPYGQVKLKEFVDLVNYLRTLHCGYALENGGGAAATRKV